MPEYDVCQNTTRTSSAVQGTLNPFRSLKMNEVSDKQVAANGRVEGVIWTENRCFSALLRVEARLTRPCSPGNVAPVSVAQNE